MVFGVNYYTKLPSAITFHYRSHFFTNKGQIGRLETIEHQHLDLVKQTTLAIKRFSCA